MISTDLPFQFGGVQLDAGVLHLRQHGDQRAFDVFVQLPEVLLLQLPFHERGELPGDVGVLGGVVRDLRHVDLEHQLLVLALADEVGDRRGPAVEVPAGEGVEAVAPLAGGEQVVGDHRVRPDRRHVPAGPQKHREVVLDVLVVDPLGRVRQDRPHRLQDRAGVERRRALRRLHGDVVRPPVPPADGPADDLRPGGVEVGRLQVHAERGLLAEFVQEVVELLRRVDGDGDEPVPVVLLAAFAADVPAGPDHRRRPLGTVVPGFFTEPLEAEVRKQREQPLVVRLGDLRVLPRHPGLEVRPQRGELLGEPGVLLVPGVGEVRPDGLVQDPALPDRLRAGRRFEDGFERAVGRQQFGRRLRADLRDAGDVVGGVADEALEVRHAVRGDAPLVPQVGRRHLLAGPAVVEVNPVREQLAGVFVRGDDPHVEPVAFAAGGEGRHHVVRLLPGDGDAGHAVRAGNLDDEGDLLFEVCGGLLAGGLVVGERFAAFGLAAFQAEDEVGRPLLFEQAPQVPGEAEDGVGGLALRPRHVRDAVVVLEHQGEGVHEVQQFSLVGHAGTVSPRPAPPKPTAPPSPRPPLTPRDRAARHDRGTGGGDRRRARRTS